MIGHEHPAMGSTMDDSRNRLGSRQASCKSRMSCVTSLNIRSKRWWDSSWHRPARSYHRLSQARHSNPNRYFHRFERRAWFSIILWWRSFIWASSRLKQSRMGLSELKMNITRKSIAADFLFFAERSWSPGSITLTLSLVLASRQPWSTFVIRRRWRSHSRQRRRSFWYARVHARARSYPSEQLWIVKQRLGDGAKLAEPCFQIALFLLMTQDRLLVTSDVVQGELQWTTHRWSARLRSKSVGNVHKNKSWCLLDSSLFVVLTSSEQENKKVEKKKRFDTPVSHSCIEGSVSPRKSTESRERERILSWLVRIKDKLTAFRVKGRDTIQL